MSNADFYTKLHTDNKSSKMQTWYRTLSRNEMKTVLSAKTRKQDSENATSYLDNADTLQVTL